MRRVLTILCVLIVASILPAANLLSRYLPADTGSFVEQKYNGWSGVLRAWVCSSWSPGGSFIRWLNTCSTEFEKAHDGVYIEFTSVSIETMRQMHTSGIRSPELVFFSPGIFVQTDHLVPTEAPPSIRNELRTCADGLVLPVAMGGYMWAYNPALCASPLSNRISEFTILPDDAGRCFSAALIGLLSAPLENPDATTSPVDSGIDLGLPVSVSVDESGFVQSEDALNRFINGDLSYLPVSQTELAKLVQLRDNGRGPDWQLYSSGNLVCADQLLLGGVTMQDDDQAAERSELAQAFITHLLSDDAQAALADIGAFCVTGQNIYPGFSAYAQMEALINNSRPVLPDWFSEHSSANTEDIVRSFLERKISAKEALSDLGFADM